MKTLNAKQRKEKMIELILFAKQKQGAQLAVKDFNIRYFVSFYKSFIEDIYSVKRHTCSFGIAVSDFVQDHETNDIRMKDIDSEMIVLLEDIKKETNPLLRLELGRKYNLLVDEFRVLNRPIAKFVNLWNKTLTKF